ncbi:MAG: tetratricopeptide repeat protein [Myxococcota bacterium]
MFARRWFQATLTVALATAVLGTSLPAGAQSDEGPQTRNYDESLDQAARLTFERAREAFVNGDYEEALRLFRQAYELSPRPVLLYNIAATLDRLRRDEEAVQALQAYLDADPDAPERQEIEARIRVLQAAIDEREAEEQARREDQERREAELEAERQRIAEENAAREASAQEDEGGGLHPAVFWVTAGAALAVGGVAAWSGADASSKDDDYRALADMALNRPGGTLPQDEEDVEAAFEEVESAQFRTNLLIGIGGTLAIGAVVLVFLTDFGGDEDDPDAEASLPSTLPQLGASPDGIFVGATHRF